MKYYCIILFVIVACSKAEEANVLKLQRLKSKSTDVFFEEIVLGSKGERLDTVIMYGYNFDKSTIYFWKGKNLKILFSADKSNQSGLQNVRLMLSSYDRNLKSGNLKNTVLIDNKAVNSSDQSIQRLTNRSIFFSFVKKGEKISIIDSGIGDKKFLKSIISQSNIDYDQLIIIHRFHNFNGNLDKIELIKF